MQKTLLSVKPAPDIYRQANIPALELYIGRIEPNETFPFINSENGKLTPMESLYIVPAVLDIIEGENITVERCYLSVAKKVSQEADEARWMRSFPGTSPALISQFTLSNFDPILIPILIDLREMMVVRKIGPFCDLITAAYYGLLVTLMRDGLYRFSEGSPLLSPCEVTLDSFQFGADVIGFACEVEKWMQNYFSTKER